MAETSSANRLRIAGLQDSGSFRYARNTGWLLGERALRLVVNLLVVIYVARYLGPERFGFLSYALSLVGLIGTLGSLGLDNILVRELVREPERGDQLLGSAFYLKLIAGIFAVCLVMLIAWWSDISDLERWMVAIIGMGLVFQSTTVVTQFFESRVQARFIARAHLVQLATSAGIKILLVFFEAELLWFAVAALLDSAVLAVALLWNYRSISNVPGYWYCHLGTARKLLQHSWPLLLSGLALSVYMKIDQMMIRTILDAQAVGQYAAAVRISEGWLVLAVVLTTSLYPAIIHAKERNESLYRQRLRAFYSLMLWLSIGIAAPVALFAESIVRLIYGDSYNPAGSVLAIHSWSGIMVFLITASSRWYLVEGLERAILWRALLGAVLNVGLNWVLIPTRGINGAAIATLLSYAAMAIAYDALDPRGRVSLRLKFDALVLPFVTLHSRSAKPGSQGR